MSSTVEPAEAAQQYFPTYHVPTEKEEISLREYDLSVAALTADQRALNLAAGLSVVSLGAFSTIAGSDNGLDSLKKPLLQNGSQGEIGIYMAILVFAIIALRYFSELQRSATNAARKLVVLRRLLGVDYGNVERILPIDRIEGANEPYAIPMFAGWGSVSSLAAIIVACFAAALLSSLMYAFLGVKESVAATVINAVLPLSDYPIVIAIGVTAMLLAVYRRSLFEDWESARFLAGRVLSVVFHCPLKRRMGHVLYRMELAVFEAKRVGVNLASLYPALLFTEDRQFHRHAGNDWGAVARAAYLRLRHGFRSGGSTIDQQLFRSTCLAKITKSGRRKLIEWIMAPWLRRRYGSNKIIDMYLCSVRFDRGVIGLPAAINHFFDVQLHSRSVWIATPAQAFFLVERLSNVSQTYPVSRIAARVRRALAANVLSPEDTFELDEIYRVQVKKGHIASPEQMV